MQKRTNQFFRLLYSAYICGHVIEEGEKMKQLIGYCGLDTCADCPDKSGCGKLAPFMDNETARKNVVL